MNNYTFINIIITIIDNYNGFIDIITSVGTTSLYLCYAPIILYAHSRELTYTSTHTPTHVCTRAEGSNILMG